MAESNNLVNSSMDNDDYTTMDLCEYFNKVLGISACSDFSNESEITDSSVYKPAEYLMMI